MKKLTVMGILIILTTIAIVLVINLYPKEVNIDEQGIKYRLGKEQKGSEQLVAVKIEGKLYKRISGERRFEGTIDIEGEEIPVPPDLRKLDILIGNDGWGAITYPYFTSSKKNDVVDRTNIHPYGSLFINSDFSKVTILLSDQNGNESDGNIGESWNNENGYMITAPASNRVEAIRLSNDLMEQFLQGLVLK
ncbi:hypothetical protein [Paenibacillus gallinarum]|uniref:Uncharacterized protein n=1 Tax=Paenibacillus gallinarum TaxID=2762232 RepID=A0ABR8T0M8_9BACL|nr:hypothetical protein [Paenibacillus gallinarum]MBD7969308.1 hypothetical protein [Paenibacillus gallinarum]